MITASSRTAPVTMNLIEVSRPRRSIPFEIDVITSAPSSACHTLPRPPNRLVPAITGPAIARSRKSPAPDDWFTARSRDGVMIHSREKSPDEVFEFAAGFQSFSEGAPLVAVPTSYHTVTEQELADNG